jgi:hypothetical protein
MTPTQRLRRDMDAREAPAREAPADRTDAELRETVMQLVERIVRLGGPSGLALIDDSNWLADMRVWLDESRC